MSPCFVLEEGGPPEREELVEEVKKGELVEKDSNMDLEEEKQKKKVQVYN